MAGRDVLGAVLAGVLRGLRHPRYRVSASEEERAWLIALGICEEAHPFGPLTLPAPDAAERMLGRALRDESIWRDFNGRNYRTLARRHGLSVRQVRRIVEERRRAASYIDGTAAR